LTSQGVDASVNGVLGGYGHVNEPDVAASDEFLMDVFRTLAHPSLSDRSKKLVALGDCSTQSKRCMKLGQVTMLETVSFRLLLDIVLGRFSFNLQLIVVLEAVSFDFR
jgi:hypothetical protein